MSTKIYNGFRIEADSLDKVLNDLSVFKYLAAKMTTKDILKERLVESVYILDKTIMNNTIFKEDIIIRKEKQKKANTINEEDKEKNKSFKINEKSSIISNAEYKLLDSFEKNKDRKNLNEYAGIQIIIYPNSITIDGKKNYLISLFGDESLTSWIEQEWKSINIKEYMYYNNTDEPENITREQWETREKHWNQVLLANGRSGIPANEGITFNLSRESRYFTYIPNEKYEQYVNEIISENHDTFSLDKRVEKYAKQYIVNQLMETIANEKGIDLYAPLDRSSTAMNIFFEAEKKMKNSKLGIAQKNTLKKQLKSLLSDNFILGEISRQYSEVVETSIENYNNLKNINKLKV